MGTSKPAILPESEWQALVASHDKLGHHEAHRALSLFPGWEYDDLLMECRLALVKAARAFDPNRVSPKTGSTIKFITLATISIRNHILGLRAKAGQLKRYGHTKRLSHQDLSELTDYRSGPNAVDARDELQHLSDLIEDVLNPKERQVIRLVAVGKPNKEIAHVVGISSSLVGTLRKSAVAKLKEAMTASEHRDA